MSTKPTGSRTGTTPLDPKNSEHVRDVAVEIFKGRLKSPTGGGSDAVERMLAEDGDGGKKMRARATAYDAIARIIMTKFVVRRRG